MPKTIFVNLSKVGIDSIDNIPTNNLQYGTLLNPIIQEIKDNTRLGLNFYQGEEEEEECDMFILLVIETGVSYEQWINTKIALQDCLRSKSVCAFIQDSSPIERRFIEKLISKWERVN